jgi:hypothetical protein
LQILYLSGRKINANLRNTDLIKHNDTVMVETIDSKEEKRRRRRASWGYIIGLFAVVFLWRAIWDWSELYFSSMGSFIIGLILIGIVALLQRDHVKNLFG